MFNVVSAVIGRYHRRYRCVQQYTIHNTQLHACLMCHGRLRQFSVGLYRTFFYKNRRKYKTLSEKKSIKLVFVELFWRLLKASLFTRLCSGNTDVSAATSKFLQTWRIDKKITTLLERSPQPQRIPSWPFLNVFGL